MSNVLDFYSFAQFNATMIGAGGTVSFGFGSGAAEEGISLRFSSAQADKQMGADGSGSISILLDKSVEFSIFLQQTSPTNKKLSLKYNIEGSGLVSPYNTIVLRNGSAEVFTITGGALLNLPDFNYTTKTSTREWKYVGVECKFFL